MPKSKKKDKDNPIETAIWIGYLAIIAAWYFIYQADEYMRFLSVGAFMFWMLATIVPFLTNQKKKENAIVTYPLITYLHRTVTISIIIGLVYSLIMGAVLGSAMQLYSSSQMESLPVVLAVLFFGFVMVAVEEKNWGMWVQPTLENLLVRFKGMSPISSFVVMVLISMISFASIHFWVGKIVITVVFGAAILRGVICIVNKITKSYLSGILIHRTVQAIALSVIFIGEMPVRLLFVAVILVITLSPYYIIPSLIKK
jgi:hypothetical protein